MSLLAKYFNTLHDQSTSVDVLDEWMSNVPILMNTDQITYWIAMQTTGHPLAHMAIDFLSIPGMYLFRSSRAYAPH